MSRPPVSVVMPFAGGAAEAQEALSALAALQTRPDDELILADNAGLGLETARVRVVAATGEQSPSHARNVGAEHAGRDWILFLDADCRATPDLLDRYFRVPIDDDVGALAGEVVPLRSDTDSFAARYGAARSFLGQDAHLSHPYLPRAVAANLLVRRTAFDAVGGFYEGVRAAEDTDFSWRLQRAGWRLVPRPGASVEHRYRTGLGSLRRQWRGYAAGRAWLARRYNDFRPQPSLIRVLARWRRSPAVPPRSVPATTPSNETRLQRGAFLAVDALLGIEELAGFMLSNRPGSPTVLKPVQVVLVADRFPRRRDPLVDFVDRLAGARVEAQARPEAFDQAAARRLTIAYREDDGIVARGSALARLAGHHPVRCARDRWRRGSGEPPLSALAPAVLRLMADPEARVLALGNNVTPAARRLAALAGRPLEDRSL